MPLGPGAKRASDELEAKTVDELKEDLRGQDLPVSGTKDELIERLEGEDDE